MKLLNELEKWFLSFWILKYKVTYLIAFIIFVFWILSLNNLPKESDPEVNLPRVNITTVYQWVSAEIIDTDITEEIEDSLEDIEWLSSVDSTSSEWRSVINIEIWDSYDIDEVISEIEDAVDGVNLPSWVDKDYPNISQMDFTSTEMFSVILYSPEDKYTFEELLDISEVLKQNTSSDSWIKEVSIDTNTIYDIRVILSKEKLDNLWLTINSIWSTISSNDIDSPIWTYEINWKNYSFKLSWKINDYNELLDIDILVWNSFIKLWDIAELDLYYWEEKINKFWKFNDSWYLYISLTYSKLSWANIFDIAPKAKLLIEDELNKSIYDWIWFYYNNDESKTITDDFNSLYKSAAITLVLVFFALIFFVGFRESIIATLILPLAFLLSFIVVENIWETLNQMTTFAFVLAFWIAIDTIVIIIEWAAEKVKQWYSSRTATLIALREFKSPIIIWTLTTISAFIPILTLPGMMGIFLSYIPLVVFITLLSTLFVSLTIAWAIFIWLSKNKKTYEVFHEREKVMNNDEKELLSLERKWKSIIENSKKSIREKIYDKYSSLYASTIKLLLKNWLTRFISTITPFVILIIFFITLVPNLWFEIFPSAKNDRLSLTIKWPEQNIPSDMKQEINFIEDYVSNLVEVKDYTLSISKNTISISMNLTESAFRLKNNQLTNTDLQLNIVDTFKKEFSSAWYTVWSKWSRRWPWSADPVWIYLTTSNWVLYNQLIELSWDFEDFLLKNKDVSGVTLTSWNPIWEIEFEINTKTAALLWISEKDIFNQVSSSIRWITSWEVKGISNDHDIKLYFDTFLLDVKPSDIENINIYSWWKTIKAGSVIDYKITKTSPSIKRWDWDIQIWISASLLDSSKTWEIQSSLNDFAKDYNFPKWITFKKWWENEKNSDLIDSVTEWVFIAFFLIFLVLVYQFNSYWQPAVILYSVFMSLIWVIFWLFITWNPISMPVWIWFISLMWIVVNDAIIMIDKINKNISKWMNLKLAITEWATSRLNPILVTTLTTAAWILPIAFQDPFWAWLWFTIAFWLTAWSFMTLFAIPTLYYSLEKRKHNI